MAVLSLIEYRMEGITVDILCGCAFTRSVPGPLSADGARGGAWKQTATKQIQKEQNKQSGWDDLKRTWGHIMEEMFDQTFRSIHQKCGDRLKEGKGEEGGQREGRMKDKLWKKTFKSEAMQAKIKGHKCRICTRGNWLILWKQSTRSNSRKWVQYHWWNHSQEGITTPASDVRCGVYKPGNRTIWVTSWQC